jgi:hypothetical protein
MPDNCTCTCSQGWISVPTGSDWEWVRCPHCQQPDDSFDQMMDAHYEWYDSDPVCQARLREDQLAVAYDKEFEETDYAEEPMIKLEMTNQTAIDLHKLLNNLPMLHQTGISEKVRLEMIPQMSPTLCALFKQIDHHLAEINLTKGTARPLISLPELWDESGDA